MQHLHRGALMVAARSRVSARKTARLISATWVWEWGIITKKTGSFWVTPLEMGLKFETTTLVSDFYTVLNQRGPFCPSNRAQPWQGSWYWLRQKWNAWRSQSLPWRVAPLISTGKTSKSLSMMYLWSATTPYMGVRLLLEVAVIHPNHHRFLVNHCTLRMLRCRQFAQDQHESI